MTFVVLAIGVVICIGLLLKGHFWSMMLGGFLGSFVGIAGLGGAIGGMIPGAVVGALIAIALTKKRA